MPAVVLDAAVNLQGIVVISLPAYEVVMGLDLQGWIADGGYVAVAVLMFVENVFPPIPSEVIMPLAGYAAAQNEDVSFAGMVAAGTVGSFLGAMFWYGIGRLVGTDRLRRWAARHGRWITLKPRDVDAAERWFDRWGWLAVLLGRMLPTVRTLISIPAGMAKMPVLLFSALTLLGTTGFTALLAVAGVVLSGGPDAVSQYIDPVSTAVVILAAVIYVYRVITFRPEPGRQGS